ncbi:hypothetical protein COU78_06975 [Candidatus Peregrinibacteria bacterium CG10_big_fil_rev_8_21_14_0_10_49_24]|nr:MAG: hypothetical protein COV83_05845 [Candidatus Peregrinibacteria bacterium CG11_big_fil_rev_8_21_14_0_20_49_14]PIR50345.1 MAG: hypothetical protein COU78_06975 [Candidatus Peregrinibacteria bacterium CG10_big_fil_rev_8_21_14_0_10_49_24]PJA67775.1 MAG: hypothetical protein CO157_02805 [Candidatus Peregrinibacteria bacterium CG_4_9_14_3_um_filter_49_12]
MISSSRTIFSASWSAYKAHMRLVVTGALLFGVVIGSAGMYVQKNVRGQLARALTSLEGMENMSAEQVEDLLLRVQAGDRSAVQDLSQRMKEISDENVAIETLPATAGLIRLAAFFSIFMWILTALSGVFYLVIAVEDPGSLHVAIKRSVHVLVPLVGLGMWISIRSFIWIPLVGFLIALLMMPRFVPAPYILLKEGRGILEAARESYARTKRFWWKIMGNIFAALLCSLLAFIALNVTLYTVSRGHMLPLSIGGSIIGQLVTAYLSFFVVALSESVLSRFATTVRK